LDDVAPLILVTRLTDADVVESEPLAGCFPDLMAQQKRAG
jgi:hypothetical protein